MTLDEWDEWLKEAKITGVRLLNDMIYLLVKAGLKNYSEVFMNFVEILSKDMIRSDE